jgi:MSHA biogenesis protein MshJ
VSDSLANNWVNLTQKFEALNTRERWMIFGAILCVFYGLFSFLISPIHAKAATLKTEIATDQAQEENLKLQVNALTQQNLVDPDLPQKQKIAALENNLKHLEDEINGLKETLISPNKMPDLLSDLLKDNAQLKLIALKTLDPSNKTALATTETGHATEKNTTPPQELPFFKHGIEMTIEGHYPDLLDYVANIEKMPWHVLWEKAELNVENPPTSQFPLSQLKLTVYTLSLDKTWLSI